MGRNFLCATDCQELRVGGGWGSPSSEDPGKEGLDVEKCRFLAHGMCNVYCVQCHSLVWCPVFLALFIEGIALARLNVLDPLAINKLTTSM